MVKQRSDLGCLLNRVFGFASVTKLMDNKLSPQHPRRFFWALANPAKAEFGGMQGVDLRFLIHRPVGIMIGCESNEPSSMWKSRISFLSASLGDSEPLAINREQRVF